MINWHIMSLSRLPLFLLITLSITLLSSYPSLTLLLSQLFPFPLLSPSSSLAKQVSHSVIHSHTLSLSSLPSSSLSPLHLPCLHRPPYISWRPQGTTPSDNQFRGRATAEILFWRDQDLYPGLGGNTASLPFIFFFLLVSHFFLSFLNFVSAARHFPIYFQNDL